MIQFLTSEGAKVSRITRAIKLEAENATEPLFRGRYPCHQCPSYA